MKKISSILMFVFFGCFALISAVTDISLNHGKTEAIILGNNNSGFEVNYRISQLKLFEVNTKEGLFSQINIENYSFSKELGKPKLPVLRKIISVPLEAKVETAINDFSLNEISLSDYGINTQIIPAQPSLSKSANPEEIEFIYNKSAYQVNEFTNRPVVSVSELGILRGMRLFVLEFRPIQYNPVQNVIKVYNDVEITVNFVGGNQVATENLRKKTFSPFFEGEYQKFVFNYSNLNIRDDLTTYPIKYVIISDRMFESQLQPFIEWKTEQGYHVIVAYTDEIGSNTSAIKSFIENIYDSATPDDPAPSFVLFVGDTQQIPAWSGNTGSHVTDVHYVDMTGDYMPEIYYGRFSANNTAQLQPQIDKTLEYEKYLMPDPSYLGEVVMIAGVDSGHAPTWGNGQINYGTTYYFNAEHNIFSHTYLYPASGSSDASIINDVSNGVGYINYTAHGSSDSWYDPHFGISDINGLQNSGKYPLAVGNCCLTNKFEVSECFGEAWLRAENKGAIGYIGGTNSTYWDEDYWWGVGAGTVTANPTFEQTGAGAYDGMFHDHGEDFSQWYTTSYAVIMAGNLAVVEAGGNMNYYWEIYALMGDPSLTPYFGVPTENIATYPSAILVGINSISISAEPYSYVGLSMNGEIYGNGIIPENGVLNLEITPFEVPGTATLVITRQNKQPVITEISVIPPDGAYLVVSGSEVVSGGDDVIEFGENAILSLEIENVGSELAHNVEATLSTDDPYITITDDYEIIGDVEAGTTINLTDGFSFSIANNVPNDHIFTMNVTMTETYRETWESQLVLIAYAPVITSGEVIVSDGQNGTLDAGETADIIVSLENSGGAAAQNIQAVLNCNDEFITINSDTDNLNLLSAGENANVSFSVTAAENTPIGHVASFTLDITADNDYSVTNNFALTIGLCLEDFENGDFSSYPWETTGAADWFISSDAHEGNYSAQSGDINDNQSSTLSVELNVLMDDEISFWKKVSSENNYDFLRFFIDGNEQGSWSGNVSWSQSSYPVSAGIHTFTWSYTKDVSVSNGSDCAWIDYIIFPPIALSSPLLDVSLNSIELDMMPNDTDSVEFELSNIGSGVINYSIYTDSHNSWLSLSTDGGVLASGETEFITAFFNSANLDVGEYTCNIIISDDRNTTQIPVILTVGDTYGDVDNNGEVQAYDASLTLQNSVGIIEFEDWQIIRADVDGNGEIQAYDASLILQYVVGIIDHFPVEGREVTSPRDELEDVVITISDFDIPAIEVGDNFEITVSTSELFEDWDVTAYQFNIHFDNSIINYSGYDLNGIIDNGGMVMVNDQEEGIISVGCITTSALSGSGSIIKLEFTKLAEGNTTIECTDFLYNTTSITNINNGEITEVNDNDSVPMATQLISNYPNPFKPMTKISLNMPNSEKVALRIYNLKGQLVKTLVDDNIKSGKSTYVWNGTDEQNNKVASGLYFYKLETANRTVTKKMIMLK